jgi:hypothetical protein
MEVFKDDVAPVAVGICFPEQAAMAGTDFSHSLPKLCDCKKLNM